MATKRAVLHIGTPKTGTSSFQGLIAQNLTQFRAQGLFYPLTGRVGWAHHNLAWELTHDRRYTTRAGSLAQLARELDYKQPTSVLLSSEDFGCLYGRPAALCQLRDALQESGYAVRIVITLRTPSDYVDSLYWQLVNQEGLPYDLETYVTTALTRGSIVHQERDYCFDYTRLLSPFAQVFGPHNLLVLPYDLDDSVRPLLSACADSLGLSLSATPSWGRLYVRPDNITHPSVLAHRLTAVLLSARSLGRSFFSLSSWSRLNADPANSTHPAVFARRLMKAVLRNALRRHRLGPRYAPLSPSQRVAVDAMFAATLDYALMKYARTASGHTPVAEATVSGEMP
jgi:hypothetical protein